MPVNNFEFEKADGIISSVQGQSVGREPISAAGIFNFVSIAQKGFGYEPMEEDMVKLIKEVSFVDLSLTTDTKLADLIPLLDAGTFICFWDKNGRISTGHPALWYLGELTLSGDTVTSAIFFSNAGNTNTIFMSVGADADGYIYFYLD